MLKPGDITTLCLLFAREAKGKRFLVNYTMFLGHRECAHNLVSFPQAFPPGVTHVLSTKSRKMPAKNNGDIWYIPISP